MFSCSPRPARSSVALRGMQTISRQFVEGHKFSCDARNRSPRSNMFLFSLIGKRKRNSRMHSHRKGATKPEDPFSSRSLFILVPRCGSYNSFSSLLLHIFSLPIPFPFSNFSPSRSTLFEGMNFVLRSPRSETATRLSCEEPGLLVARETPNAKYERRNMKVNRTHIYIH